MAWLSQMDSPLSTRVGTVCWGLIYSLERKWMDGLNHGSQNLALFGQKLPSQMAPSNVLRRKDLPACGNSFLWILLFSLFVLLNLHSNGMLHLFWSYTMHIHQLYNTNTKTHSFIIQFSTKYKYVFTHLISSSRPMALAVTLTARTGGLNSIEYRTGFDIITLFFLFLSFFFCIL